MGGKEKYIERAQRYILRGHLERAIEEYKGAIAIDPQDVTLRLRLGDLYVKTGRKEDAIKEYSEAAKINNQKGFYLKAIAVYKQILKLDDTNLDVHYKLAELYTKQRLLADAISEYSYILNVFERKGRTQDAFDLLKKMVEVDPNNTGVRLRLAKKELELGYEDDAIEEYCTIFDKLLSQRRLERAEKIIKEIYERYPQNTAIIEKFLELYKKKEDNENYLKYALKLVDLYREKGDKEATIALCNEILERFPDNQQARTILEEVAPKEEEVDFSELSEEEPEEVVVEVSEEQEKEEPEEIEVSTPLEEELPEEETIETVEEEVVSVEEELAQKVAPQEATAEPAAMEEKAEEEVIMIPDELFEEEEPLELEVERAHTDEEEPQEIELLEEVHEEATEVAEHAQKKTEEPEQYVDLMKELGVEEALEQLVSPVAEGSTEDMAEELKEDMGEQLTKEDAETHYNLGIAYMEMELFDEAINEFKLSLKDPSLEFDALTRLGLCSTKKGAFDEAIEFYEKALAIEGKTDDDRKAVMYELASTLEAAGRREEALDVFRKVYDMDRDYRNVAEKVESLSRPAPPLDDDMIEVEVV